MTKMTDEEFNQKAMMQDPNPEKAIFWLVNYAEEIGNAFGRMKRADLNRKTVRSIEYDRAKGTNTDRMMEAERSAAYVQACDEFENTCADYIRLNILKEAAVLKISVWQSKVKAGLEGNP